ncbi:hypothetical protein ABPG74_000132 [Tetrahymena malaccensis]
MNQSSSGVTYETTSLELEKKLIDQKVLTKTQIDEIRKLFTIIDTDHSGELSTQEMRNLIIRLSQNRMTEQEINTLITNMDSNKDGTIQWHEFLQALAEYLSQNGVLREINNDNDQDGVSLIFERKMVHLEVLQFLTKNMSDFEKHILDIEQNDVNASKLGNYNFFAHVSEPAVDKVQFFQECQLVFNNEFQNIVEHLHSADQQKVLQAVDVLTKLMELSRVFKTPHERFKISHLLIKIYDLVEFSLIKRICNLIVNSTEPNIVWKSLQVATLYAAGPRLAYAPVGSKYEQQSLHYQYSLFKEGIVQSLLGSYLNSDIIELKGQSVLLIGFLAKGNKDIRDYLLSENAHVIIGENCMKLLNNLNDQNDYLESIYHSWTLSILAGQTLPQGQKIYDLNVILNLADSLQKIFLNFTADDTLANAVVGLGYLLPFIEITQENCFIWQKIIEVLVKHNSFKVKVACLSAIKKIVMNNSKQAQFIIECDFLSICQEFLSSGQSQYTEIQLEILSIIEKLIKQGFYFYIISNYRFVNFLYRKIYDQSIIKQKILLIIEALLSKVDANFIHVVDSDLQRGLVHSLQDFREKDKIMQEFYNYYESTYNLEIMKLSFDSLNWIAKHLQNYRQLNDAKYNRILSDLLDIANYSKIQSALEMLFNDIFANKVDVALLHSVMPYLIESYQQFLQNCFTILSKPQDLPFDQQFTHSLQVKFNELINYIKVKQEAFQDYLKRRPQNASFQNIILNCYYKQYPNGENKEIVVPSSHTLLQALIQVEEKFKVSPIEIFIVYENGQYANLNQEGLYENIVQREVASSPNITPKINIILFDMQHISMQKRINASEKFFDLNHSNTLDDFFQEGSVVMEDKNRIVSELLSKTGLDREKIENLYNQFKKASMNRVQNKNIGSFTHQEFKNILFENGIDNTLSDNISQLLDFRNTGLIDFRDFVCYMSILISGNLEEKLKLAYQSYDINGDGFLDKNEVARMFEVAGRLRGISFSIDQLKSNTEEFFKLADQNNDGQISYSEFRIAIQKRPEIISEFFNVIGNSFSQKITRNVFGVVQTNNYQNNNLFGYQYNRMQ